MHVAQVAEEALGMQRRRVRAEKIHIHSLSSSLLRRQLPAGFQISFSMHHFLFLSNLQQLAGCLHFISHFTGSHILTGSVSSIVSYLLTSLW